jgi:hypothetical protein
MKILITGVFFILHGLVHGLYFGQSRRFFELRPNMVWPDGSWVVSRLLGDETTRLLASVCLVLAGLGFVAGGMGVFARQAWWRPVVVASAALSTVIWLLFWNGKFQALDDQGGIAILINVAILLAVLAWGWLA